MLTNFVQALTFGPLPWNVLTTSSLLRRCLFLKPGHLNAKLKSSLLLMTCKQDPNLSFRPYQENNCAQDLVLAFVP